MNDSSSRPPGIPDAGTELPPASSPRSKRGLARRLLRALAFTLLALMVVLGVAFAAVYSKRNELIREQGLARLGPLIGGNVEAEGIDLALRPLRLTLSGIHLQVPQIKGKISASSLVVDPIAGTAVVDGLEIQRPDGLDKLPVFTTKRVAAKVEIAKVIRAPYPVDDVRIEEPVVRVRLLEPGWTNLQDVLGLKKPNAAATPPLKPLPPAVPAASPRPPAAANGTPATAIGGAKPALFYLRHAEIVSGTLVYDDPMSHATDPVHLEVRDLAVDMKDFQLEGAPVASPLTDVRIDGRIVQPQQNAYLHARSWAEPWRDRPTITLLAAITGFDVRTIDPYTSFSGGMALGGDWLHVLLDVRAKDAKIEAGLVTVTVAETGTELKAPFTGDLFRPTVDRDSALVSIFQLPVGHLLRMGNVSLDVAGQLAMAGLESVFALGQAAGDAGSAVVGGGGAAADHTGGAQAEEGSDDFFSSVGRGIAAFGSGVAKAAQRLFQGGQDGVAKVTGSGQPIEKLLVEFEPRHKELERVFLRQRIAVAREVDSGRVSELEKELADLGPSPAPAVTPP